MLRFDRGRLSLPLLKSILSIKLGNNLCGREVSIS